MINLCNPLKVWKILIKICQNCQQEYKTYKSKSKFCSSKCTGESQSNKILKVCQHCGNEYKVHKYRDNTSLFCSSECREKAQYLPGFDGENKICTDCHELKPLSGFWNGRTKCKDCLKKRSQSYYEKNKDKIAEWGRKYRTENIELLRNQKRIYRAKNREEVRKGHKKWRDKHPEYVKLQRIKDEQVRRARKYKTVSDLTHDDWLDTLEYFNNECAYCGRKEDLQQDHFIPVKNGGGYEKVNIIPACPFCNQSKGDRDFYRWYEWQSFHSIERWLNIEEFFIEHNTEGSPSGNRSEPVESRGRLKL